ncbi:uncharacterized protein F5891DRAFT_984340 [Suillus fuscotomentosus]|uniref:Uncharacterized protein n=1 Tax=Suillus fuscotomentosus TaxID=1912939 RepID=A0AAD4HG23_9AGAM|nr:uncharacterized protein F5891DRAFT_984340 [Suillus fuscotomentosus]KAG1895258.1 hypothetical protein F5891DRAFT_984340 [Suillus fuscotomentosus]
MASHSARLVTSVSGQCHRGEDSETEPQELASSSQIVENKVDLELGEFFDGLDEPDHDNPPHHPSHSCAPSPSYIEDAMPDPLDADEEGNSMHKEHVSAAAAKLLKTGEYLRLPNSSEVLKKACLSFYYGNGKKALKLTDEFQHQIPVNGLILVATVAKGVLSGFCDSGIDKSIDKLMDVPKHCVELEEMLREWAKEGMIGELCNDSDSAVDSEDNNIII